MSTNTLSLSFGLNIEDIRLELTILTSFSVIIPKQIRYFSSKTVFYLEIMEDVANLVRGLEEWMGMIVVDGHIAAILSLKNGSGRKDIDV